MNGTIIESGLRRGWYRGGRMSSSRAVFSSRQHERLNLHRARRAWSYAGLAALAVAAACGRADDPPATVVAPQGAAGSAGSGAFDSSTGSGETDAGPAPQDTGATNATSWARRPPEGLCIPYEDSGEGSANQRVFSSEAECEQACGCTLLECVCNGLECPSSIEEATQDLCAPPNNDFEPLSQVVRRTGCGQVYLASSNGFAGRGWLFAQNADSASSASLVGSTSFVDVDTEPCAMYSWAVGETFDCDEAVACRVCGEPLGGPLPDCD